MMGAIWGDPYTIGGNGGYPPSEPLESVFSPPSRGCPWVAPGYGPWEQGPQANRWVHPPTVLCPPRGGPDGTPLYWGGVVS